MLKSEERAVKRTKKAAYETGGYSCGYFATGYIRRVFHGITFVFLLASGSGVVADPVAVAATVAVAVAVACGAKAGA